MDDVMRELTEQQAAQDMMRELTVTDTVRKGIATWNCATSLEWKERATAELIQAHVALDQARHMVETVLEQMAKMRAAFLAQFQRDEQNYQNAKQVRAEESKVKADDGWHLVASPIRPDEQQHCIIATTEPELTEALLIEGRWWIPPGLFIPYDYATHWRPWPAPPAVVQ